MKMDIHIWLSRSVWKMKANIKKQFTINAQFLGGEHYKEAKQYL